MSKSKTSKGLGRGLTDMPHYQDHFSSGAKHKHPLFRSPDELEAKLNNTLDNPKKKKKKQKWSLGY